MSNRDVAAIILAAGKGTRMQSDLAKVLHPLAGKPLIGHVLDTCAEMTLGQTVVVVGYQGDRVEAAVSPWRPTCVMQREQLGTGHAVLCAENEVSSAIALVLYGDCPLIPETLLRDMLSTHRRRHAACTVVAARMADPARYGRMVTDAEGKLTRIVEYKDASESERAIDLINTGIYAFATDELFRCLKLVRPTNAQGEYYLTDVIAMMVAEHKRVELVITDQSALVMGVNTPEELAEAERVVMRRAAASAKPV
jgi:bifunctional UDP-N-acetylglucosamine pyrophosphorylase / glucosamine-1-phosphate N-acetyltransferase